MQYVTTIEYFEDYNNLKQHRILTIETQPLTSACKVIDVTISREKKLFRGIVEKRDRKIKSFRSLEAADSYVRGEIGWLKRKVGDAHFREFSETLY